MTEARTLPATGVHHDGRRITGYAAVYDTESRDLGGFTERIAPGAFDEVLATDPDVVATLNHDESAVLGRTRSGTLRLETDARGLRFEVDLPDSPLGENVRAAVGRGDITGASFRFRVDPSGESWDGSTRTLTRVTELLDVTVATRGAYPAAAVELRTQPEPLEAEKMETSTEAPEAVEEAVEAPTASDAPVNEARTHTGGLRVEDRAHTPRPAADRLRDALLDIRVGEVRALTTASALSPGELSSHLFDKLTAASVALTSGIQVISTDKDSVVFPRLTADVASGWTAEATQITATDPTLDTVTATPRKLAARTIFSNEVIDDSDPSAIDVVQNSMLRDLALRLDRGIYEGTGTAPEIRGLKNVIGSQTVSMGTDGAALTNLDPFADALALLETANAAGGVIVMPARTWGKIRKLKDSQNRPLVGNGSQDAPATIFGRPVYVTTQLSITETQGAATTASSVYVYDPSQVYLVRRQDVTVELDRSRLFDTDQSELRGKMRADLICPNPTAIIRITGVL